MAILPASSSSMLGLKSIYCHNGVSNCLGLSKLEYRAESNMSGNQLWVLSSVVTRGVASRHNTQSVPLNWHSLVTDKKGVGFFVVVLFRFSCVKVDLGLLAGTVHSQDGSRRDRSGCGRCPHSGQRLCPAF